MKNKYTSLFHHYFSNVNTSPITPTPLYTYTPQLTSITPLPAPTPSPYLPLPLPSYLPFPLPHTPTPPTCPYPLPPTCPFPLPPTYLFPLHTPTHPLTPPLTPPSPLLTPSQYIWRYDERGRLRDSYPSLVHNLFSGLPKYLKKVDAAYERPSDGNILFFIGKYYYVHNGDRLVEGSPLPLTTLGLPERLTKIDAAFYWPRAKRTYFFNRHEYYRYNEKTQAMDQGYPKNMAKWNGLPDNLDAVFTWKDGVSYFVKGKDYWKYDNVKIRPFSDYPKNAVEYWADCPSSSWGP
ncbi:Matrix metalloproteinase-24 [Penaeus vannamei]|uniref:Matrix metalloproteinase-24 n=1 Tax=Penaeus vannamei TaxID=6689 RepID=A0A3R7N0P6_PENVA|nr:Matrix metalloproteinase-24 [Penaeus vannamei]